eukprot:1186180-Prorocentrum_minimum.AAC.2
MNTARGGIFYRNEREDCVYLRAPHAHLAPLVRTRAAEIRTSRRFWILEIYTILERSAHRSCYSYGYSYSYNYSYGSGFTRASGLDISPPIFAENAKRTKSACRRTKRGVDKMRHIRDDAARATGRSWCRRVYAV